MISALGIQPHPLLFHFADIFREGFISANQILLDARNSAGICSINFYFR